MRRFLVDDMIYLVDENDIVYAPTRSGAFAGVDAGDVDAWLERDGDTFRPWCMKELQDLQRYGQEMLLH